jgi:hypothetical protein
MLKWQRLRECLIAVDSQQNDGKHVMLNEQHLSFIKYRIHILRPATSPYFAVLAEVTCDTNLGI